MCCVVLFCRLCFSCSLSLGSSSGGTPRALSPSLQVSPVNLGGPLSPFDPSLVVLRCVVLFLPLLFLSPSLFLRWNSGGPLPLSPLGGPLLLKLCSVVLCVGFVLCSVSMCVVLCCSSPMSLILVCAFWFRLYGFSVVRFGNRAEGESQPRYITLQTSSSFQLYQIRCSIEP